MTSPRWARSLLRRVAPPHRVDEVLGDLEESYRNRIDRSGRVVATLVVAFETIDMVVALLRERMNPRHGRRHRALRTVLANVPAPSWLDFKLGLRMLGRHPSLTTSAVLAMGFGIAMGATAFEVVKDQVLPPLPYRDAARIVRIQNVNRATTRPDARALFDFYRWRTRLHSVQELSALSLRDRNLVVPEGDVLPVATAAVSASAFRLIDAAPLLGRALTADDELNGSPPVAVIGYRLWRTQFGGSPDVVGKDVRLAGELTTIVGVMPKGFMFLVPRPGFTFPDPQDLWTPFRLRALDYPPGQGPAIIVFGRLTRGATEDELRAELTAFPARMAGASTARPDQLTPRLLSFALPFSNAAGLAPSAAISLTALFIATLMIVICGNVALLLFARAATREREIALRNALGASRGRIVAQLFIEALVLAGVAILVGLAGASAGLRWVLDAMESMVHAQGLSMPPWIGDTLSPTTVGYAVVLAAIGAIVAGVLPGITVTSSRDRTPLQRLAGGGTTVRLSKAWMGIIVTQVALTVALVPIAVLFGVQTWKLRATETSLPGPEYLAVRLESDDARQAGSAGAASIEPFVKSYRELERRLASEPGVTGVTVASSLPGSVHERRRFQLEAPDVETQSSPDASAQIASVDQSFFDVMRTPILAGRGLRASDFEDGQSVIIVNESFARQYFRGRSAVGHRLRYRTEDGGGPWYTIVGVSRDLAMTIDPTIPSNAGIYHPLERNGAHPIEMAVRVTGQAPSFAARLRDLAADVDPVLRVQRALPLNQAARANIIAYDATFRALALAGVMALLLANAGIYAVISFTVARRTREIGIRVALGAGRRQVLSAVLSRTSRSVALGVVAGAAVGSCLAIGFAEGAERPTIFALGVLMAAYVCGMMSVCLLAGVGPMRRALKVDPVQALASDG